MGRNSMSKNGAFCQFGYFEEFVITNFDAVLKDTPATFAVVEFFAHGKS
jgi:hypothetical protein